MTKRDAPEPAVTVWTIGHSTRTSREFVAALRAHEIELVVDVRRFPASRRLPRFNAVALRHTLESRGIAYHWIEALGGRRPTLRDSLMNAGWRHPAFRGYADYAATPEFADGLFELLMIAEGLRTAVMCAEVLWWRCHRRIIADVLTSLGIRVEHIQTAAATSTHRLAPPARIIRGEITYLPA